MKICAKCKRQLPLSEFNKTRDGKRVNAYCKRCHSHKQLDKYTDEELHGLIRKHRKSILRIIDYMQTNRGE